MTREQRNELNMLRRKEEVCPLDKYEIFRLCELEALAKGFKPEKEEK